MDSREMLQKVFDILEEKKGEDIVAYDISKVSSLADYFVICTGNSSIHVNAITDYLLDAFKEEGFKPFAIEGYGKSKWICLDFGAVIVNIMDDQERDYYRLENIWGACEKITR